MIDLDAIRGNQKQRRMMQARKICYLCSQDGARYEVWEIDEIDTLAEKIRKFNGGNE